MNKSEIRVKTKLLAKATLHSAFIRVVFVLALELLTAIVLSLVFSELAEKLFPLAIIRIWKYEFNYMHVVFGILGSLFSLPLTLGAAEYLLSVVRRKPAKISDIFLWFADSDKLKTVLSYFVWIAFLSIFSFLMQTLASKYIVNQINNVLGHLSEQIQSGIAEPQPDFSIMDVKGILVSVVLIVLYYILSARFMLLPYLMVDNSKLSTLKAVGMSWSIMRGHTFEYIVLLMSFIGWFLAMVFTAFILGIYFIPYFELTNVIFSEYVRADKKLREAPAA